MELFYRASRVQGSYILPIVVVLLIVPSTWAIDVNQENHHISQEMPILYKCNDSTYPSDWEKIMTQLDKEKETFESERLTTTLTQSQFAEALNQLTQKFGSPSFQSDTSSSENSNKDGDRLEFWGMGDDTGTTNSWHPHPKLMGVSEQSDMEFSLQNKSFQCPAGRASAVFHWHSILNDQPKTSQTSLELSDMTILPNGMLAWKKPNKERHIFKKDDYCILKHSKEWVTFKVCLPSPCSDNNPCIRKCCLPSELIDEETRSCKRANPPWKPKFYRTAADTETSMGDSVAEKASVIVGLPNCRDRYMFNDGPGNKYVLIDGHRNQYVLLLNGSLVEIWNNEKFYIPPNFFCIDGLYYKKQSEERIFQGSEWDQVVIACTPTETGTTQQVQEIRIMVYAILNFVSAFFLLLTDVVYILIWKHQNNIQSWLQFSYATSLLFTFACFSINQLYSNELWMSSAWLCKGMGWLTHLMYLSSFFWLTSMVLEFSRSFQSARIETQGKMQKRFRRLAWFSLVIPSGILCIGIALDYNYMDSLSEPPITIPGFGREKCYFQSKRAQIPYLYFPAGILLLVSFILFASTLLRLRKKNINKEPLAGTQATSSMKDEKGVRVLAKLLVLMGVLWMFELLSWICQLIFTELENKTIIILIFTPIDCFNTIQGVLVFCILICKPDVTKHLFALFKKENSGKARKASWSVTSFRKNACRNFTSRDENSHFTSRKEVAETQLVQIY